MSTGLAAMLAIRIVLQGYEFYKKLYKERCEATKAAEGR